MIIYSVERMLGYEKENIFGPGGEQVRCAL